MTDRELLENAAKAADMDIAFDRPRATGKEPMDWDTGEPWNPLTDDGDALRLMVRLAMTVRQEPSAAAAGWGADCFGAPTVDRRGPWFWKEWFSDNKDPLAATRRAIVEAAAKIGRSME